MSDPMDESTPVLAGIEIDDDDAEDVLVVDDLLANIKKAWEGLTGNEIANIHNDVCARKIEYIEDSMWRYTGEKDDEE
jgi:hypothetical protein